MKTMTTEQLQAIRERAEKATPTGHVHEKEWQLRQCKACWDAFAAQSALGESAIQDIPSLLAYIEQLEAMVDASGDYDMGAVCRNCGETYGQHIGYECPKSGGTFLPTPPASTPNEKA